ncbi:glutathione S-transferase [Pseudomonas sp.]|uniref:glutathione S-transferase family protein n=1 Tax=Pseudomonas sp. TaxID=306 RepID=UPI002629B105|nr:glutathione S-transferase [Pseudomonas sp.]
MTTESIKLYHSAGSPNSRRVRVYLAERGVEVELVSVDLGAKEQFSEAYRAINPRSVVPTLVLADGTSIGEVPAIIQYFEESYSTRPLLGSTPKGKALITMWERRVEQEGFASVMEGVRNAVPALKGRAIAGPHNYEQIAELADRSKLRVSNFYDDLNQRLTEVPFIAGTHFSVADITALVTIDFGTHALSVAIGESRPALKNWYDAVSSRPSATA